MFLGQNGCNLPWHRLSVCLQHPRQSLTDHSGRQIWGEILNIIIPTYFSCWKFHTCSVGSCLLHQSKSCKRQRVLITIRLGQIWKFWNLTELILGFLPIANWWRCSLMVSPQKNLAPPSMAIRFYYISSVHNKVLRFWQPCDKAASTLFLV